LDTEVKEIKEVSKSVEYLLMGIISTRKIIYPFVNSTLFKHVLHADK